MKAASLELIGLMAYYNCHVGLHVPLMCVVDFKGFRVVAESILPIGKDSLVYGSDNAGAVVHKDEPSVFLATSFLR